MSQRPTSSRTPVRPEWRPPSSAPVAVRPRSRPRRSRAGARVSATFVAATGPKSQVTGARTTPTSVPDVFESRLAPCGTFTAPEKNTLCAWAIAQAGQAMNQTSCAGSPQPHVSIADGWPDQTCHQRRTVGTVKQTSATRWKPTAHAPLGGRGRELPALGRAPPLPGSRNRASLPCRPRGRRRARDALTPPSHSSPPLSVLPGLPANRGRSRPVRVTDPRAPPPSLHRGGRRPPRPRCCMGPGAPRLEVLVLEAAGRPGHPRSGSKGDARIFRLGYPEPHYVATAVLARSPVALPSGGARIRASAPRHRPGVSG